MRVLIIHKPAKFGCFISKMTKLQIIYLGLQPNSRWPLAAKLLMGPEKVCGWHRSPLSSCKIWWNRTTHFGVTRESDVFYTSLSFLFLRFSRWWHWRLQQKITSVFIGRFGCDLQLFRGRNALSADGTDLKLSLGALRLAHECPRKISKYEKMGAKYVITSLAI